LIAFLERWSPAIFYATLSALALLCTTEHRENYPLLAPLAVVAVLSAIGVWRRRRAHFKALGIESSFIAKMFTDVATVFGAGLTPRGSGTAGAVATLPLTYLLARLELLPRIAALVLITALSVYATAQYLKYEKRVLDPKEVVVDELVGVAIAIAFVPWTFLHVAGAFVLFRIFDIWKPGPIRYVEHRLPGAYGVMFDDVLAGIFAGLLMLLFARVTMP
jgi:phosphatidylglycerophosphatase A